MKRILYILIFIFHWATVSFSQTEVTIKNSPKTIVLVGNNNSVTNVKNIRITYHFSLNPNEKEILGFLNQANRVLGVSYVDSKYDASYKSHRSKIYFIKNLENDKFIYLINLNDNIAVDLNFYSLVIPDTLSGLHIVQSKVSYGFINNRGNVIVKTEYKKVWPFQSNPNTIVESDSGFAVINKMGSSLLSIDKKIGEIKRYNSYLFTVITKCGIDFRYDATKNTLSDSKLYSILKGIRMSGITGVLDNDSVIILKTYLGNTFTYNKSGGNFEDLDFFQKTLNYSEKLIYFTTDNSWYSTGCLPFDTCYETTISSSDILKDMILVLKKYKIKNGCEESGRIDSFFSFVIYNVQSTSTFGPGYNLLLPKFKLLAGNMIFDSYPISPFNCEGILDSEPSVCYIRNGEVFKSDYTKIDSFINNISIATSVVKVLIDTSFREISTSFTELDYSGRPGIYIGHPLYSQIYALGFCLYDATNRKIISSRFDSIGRFENGYALCRVSKNEHNKTTYRYGFLDFNGNLLTGTTFDEISPFNISKRATVRLNGKVFTLDEFGKLTEITK